MNFSNEELIDMAFILGESQRNCLLASRIYAVRYPNRRHPHFSAFEKLKARFLSDGSVKYKCHVRPKTVVTEENEVRILEAIVDDPHTSTRKISKNFDISRRSVARILKKKQISPVQDPATSRTLASRL